jgi:DNA-binding NtrC family response regulator
MSRAILFVDDEILVLSSLKYQVKRHFGTRFRYETANDAGEAWEIIEELTQENIEILIIISDWLMPKIKGDEFLKQVHIRFPDVKKVIISGQADEDSIQRLFQEIDLHSYIRKPWDERELLDTIEAAVSESSQ